MLDLLKKKEHFVNLKQVNELMSKFNKKEELDQKKTNTWLIVGLVALGLVIVGLIVYKVTSSGADDFDDFDDFDDDFDDMDYDEDYDEFDDYDEESFEDIEDIEE